MTFTKETFPKGDWHRRTDYSLEDLPNSALFYAKALNSKADTVKMSYIHRINKNKAVESKQNSCTRKLMVPVSDEEVMNFLGIYSSKEPKFEVGKYYYFESYPSKVPTMAKCDSISDSFFESKNWIMLYSSKYAGEGTWSIKDISNVRQVSLEEIQQYLPEGHPDKLDKKQELNIRAGEIYHATSKSVSFEYIFIACSNGKNCGYKQFINKPCSSSPSFHPNPVFSSSFSWEDYNLREATNEEKEWLKACIKVGKFVPKSEVNMKCSIEKELEYKVGDWIVPLVHSGDGESGYHIRKVGKAYQIYEVYPNIQKVRVYNDYGSKDGSGSIHAEELRKARPEEIPITYHSVSPKELPELTFEQFKEYVVEKCPFVSFGTGGTISYSEGSIIPATKTQTKQSKVLSHPEAIIIKPKKTNKSKLLIIK